MVAATAVLVALDRLPGAALAVTAVFAVADVLPEALPRWSTAVTGAAVLALAVDPVAGFPSGAVAGALALGVGIALGALATTVGPLVGALLVLGSALGVYLTVPDTEGILAVGVVLVALVGLVLWPSRPGWSGSFALGGLLAWTAADGARGRPGAAVGALACVALVALPVAVAALVAPNRPEGTPRPRTLVALLVVQALAVLVCSRWAGLETAAGAALAIVLPTLAITAGLEGMLLRRRGDH